MTDSSRSYFCKSFRLLSFTPVNRLWYFYIYGPKFNDWKDGITEGSSRHFRDWLNVWKLKRLFKNIINHFRLYESSIFLRSKGNKTWTTCEYAMFSGKHDVRVPSIIYYHKLDEPGKAVSRFGWLFPFSKFYMDPNIKVYYLSAVMIAEIVDFCIIFILTDILSARINYATCMFACKQWTA